MSSGDDTTGVRIVLCPDDGRPVMPQSRVFSFYSTDGLPMRLEIRAGEAASDGDITDCEHRDFPVEASEILWGGPVAPKDAVRPASGVTLQGLFTKDKVTIGEIEWFGHIDTSRENLSSTVSLSGNVDSLPRLRRAEASKTRASRSGSRSAWIWSPNAWRTYSNRIWALAKAERLEAIFITVPVVDGVVEHPDDLGDFIRAARRRDIAVWAVAGDPHDVLPEARSALLARVAAYKDYNEGVGSKERLAGLQLDIEPYLLPGFALAPDYWRERYLDMFAAVHGVVSGRMPLDMVVPVWWGSHPDWGDAFLRGMARSGVSLTVMNYRTHPEALRAGAQPFLEAGDRHGYAVRMALEAGPLADETRRTYRAAGLSVDPHVEHAIDHSSASSALASLWLTEVGSTPILILLVAPREAFPGAGYVFSHETAAPADNLTFGPDSMRREKVVQALEKEWRAWKSFAGLAIHGLDTGFP